MNHLIVKLIAYKLYSINRLGYFDTIGLVCKVFYFYDVNNKHCFYKKWLFELLKLGRIFIKILIIFIELYWHVVCIFISLWSISFTIIFEGIMGLGILSSCLKVTSGCYNLSPPIFFIMLKTNKRTEELRSMDKSSNFLMLFLQILKLLASINFVSQALF